MNYKSWSNKEKEIIIQNYQTKTLKELNHLLPNRTLNAIHHRITILRKKGYKIPLKHYKTEINTPIVSWLWRIGMTGGEIAKMFNVHRLSIYQKVYNLRNKKKNPLKLKKRLKGNIFSYPNFNLGHTKWCQKQKTLSESKILDIIEKNGGSCESSILQKNYSNRITFRLQRENKIFRIRFGCKGGFPDSKISKLIDGPTEKSQIIPNIKSEIALDTPAPYLDAEKHRLFLYYSVADRADKVWKTVLTTFNLTD